MQHIAKQETKLSWASGGKHNYMGPILFKKNGISRRKEVWSTTDPKSVGKLMADKWQYFGFFLSRVPGGWEECGWMRWTDRSWANRPLPSVPGNLEKTRSCEDAKWQAIWLQRLLFLWADGSPSLWPFAKPFLSKASRLNFSYKDLEKVQVLLSVSAELVPYNALGPLIKFSPWKPASAMFPLNIYERR